MGINRHVGVVGGCTIVSQQDGFRIGVPHVCLDSPSARIPRLTNSVLQLRLFHAKTETRQDVRCGRSIFGVNKKTLVGASMRDRSANLKSRLDGGVETLFRCQWMVPRWLLEVR